MNPYSNVMFGTLFEALWSALSSKLALTLYFILLFGSIAAMIISVLYLTTEKKPQAKKPGDKENPDEADAEKKPEETVPGQLDIVDDDDITSLRSTMTTSRSP